MTKKILITGGAGFIGLHLATHLESSGYKLCLVDNFSRAVDDTEIDRIRSLASVELVDMDLGNLPALMSLGDRYEVVLHLAAIIGVAHVAKQPYKVLTENIRTLDNVIEFCKQQKKLSRLVFASTSEVYSGTLENYGLSFPTSEETPLVCGELRRPRSSYMLSKIYGESLCIQSGLPFTVLRPHNVYGPRMGLSHVIPEQMSRIWRADPGSKVGVYSPDHRRTFCYIFDAVQMIQQIIQNETTANQIFNLGSVGPEITISELIRKCILISGKELDIEPLPDTDGSPVRRCPDMSKMYEYTGYTSQVGLCEGLRQTWEWYTDNVFASGGLTAV